MNTENMGIEALGIQKGSRGEGVRSMTEWRPTLPAFMQSAMLPGDHLLAHVASKQGIVAARNACGKDEKWIIP